MIPTRGVAGTGDVISLESPAAVAAVQSPGISSPGVSVCLSVRRVCVSDGAVGVSDGADCRRLQMWSLRAGIIYVSDGRPGGGGGGRCHSLFREDLRSDEREQVGAPCGRRRLSANSGVCCP